MRKDDMFGPYGPMIPYGPMGPMGPMGNPFAPMMGEMIRAQGKTPITSDFVKAVERYYLDKLYDLPKFSQIDRYRTRIWQEICRCFYVRYPPKQMTKLLNDDETKDMVEPAHIRNIRLSYTGEDGKTVTIYGDDYLPRDRKDLEIPYVLVDADPQIISLTENLANGIIIKLRNLDQPFKEAKEEVLNHIETILKEAVSIEDVYEMLPELKKANLYVKETAKCIGAINALNVMFEKSAKKAKK